ncbi:MAG: LysM peptidoglycan-binding domain-containing protein [Phycisphaerales bacterium]|nr:LysM peptidoglycan-binding domain-containing protein [Phycisphaerales bacterium]
MMDERTSRIFIGLCLLVLVWIGVYWMWQPSREHKTPRITFEQPVQTDPIPQQPEDTSDQPSIIDQTRIARTGDPEPPVTTGPTGPTLQAPEFFEHTVLDKETMQTIAAQYLGSREQWSVIARANPFVDPQKLRQGMILRIPKDPSNIQGRVTGRETPEGVIESHTNPEVKVIEYVVRPGDSLSRISQRIYGSSRHARFIYENNRDVLKSIDDISVGQLLRLPPLPEGEGESP